MTEFTKEFIEELKYDVVFHSDDEQIKQRIVEALDEIERLQQRIAELEQERRWIQQDKTLIVKKDGDSWFAVRPDFKDLQESESRWFNDTINQYMDAIYWYLNDEPQPPQEEE